MREWIIENRIISDEELVSLEEADRQSVEGIRKSAWEAYLGPILEERAQVLDMLDEVGGARPRRQSWKPSKNGWQACRR